MQVPEEGCEVRELLREECVYLPTVVKTEPVFAIYFLFEKITSVLQAEKIARDEVHGGRVPDLMNVDAVWMALRR